MPEDEDEYITAEAVGEILAPSSHQAMRYCATDDIRRIEGVSEKLKVTRQAIHNWIKEGRIESIKIGRARRLSAASIERLLEQSRQP